MLSIANFEEFIDDANTLFYNFCIWKDTNNEWANVQQNSNNKGLSKIIMRISNALLFVWILGVARLLDAGYSQNKTKQRLSVDFILNETNNQNLIDYYAKEMGTKEMKKFIVTNRQLRNEKLSHKTPGSKANTQKAGIENYFEIIKYIVNELKKDKLLNTSKSIGYTHLESQAKAEVAKFIKKFQ